MVDDEVIAGGLYGEVAVDDFGSEEALFDGAALEVFEDGSGVLVDGVFELFGGEFTLFKAPLAAEEGEFVDVGEDVLDLEVGEDSAAPEGGYRDGVVGGDGGVVGGVVGGGAEGGFA